MIIRDGFSEFLEQEELKKLISKIIDLSEHNEYVFDSILHTKKQSNAFYKALEDDFLARNILLHIFLNNKYTGTYLGLDDLIPDVFEDLSYTQQSKFLKYYDALKIYAIEYGFLTKYEAIRARLNIKFSKIIKFAGWAIALWLVYSYATSFTDYLLAVLLFVINELPHTNISSDIKQQNDIIIQKLNKDRIDKTRNYSKKYLVDSGWIKEDKKSINQSE